MKTIESINKGLAQRLHNEAWDEGNDALIDELIADDYVEHSTAHPQDVHGPAGFKREAEQLQAAFPDLTVTEEDSIAEGDKVASRVTFRGTHEGEFQDLPPTGTSVEFEVMVINRFEDGQLAEAWVQVDVMGLMQQLGVVEEPGPEDA